MDTHTHHEHVVSASHRRALRLRLASALVAAVLVVAGTAGIGAVGPMAVESVFGVARGQ
jgi:hypothetical protein